MLENSEYFNIEFCFTVSFLLLKKLVFNILSIILNYKGVFVNNTNQINLINQKNKIYSKELGKDIKLLIVIVC